jgi:uncharacterized protein (DUF1499 family)
MSDQPTLFDRVKRTLTHNVADTRDSEVYPDLKPRRYAAGLQEVFEALVRVIEGRERWEIVESSHEEREASVAAEVETKWAGFVDDLSVDLSVEGDEVVVHARSASRVGKGDMGQNARTVRELFDRLDEQMQRR